MYLPARPSNTFCRRRATHCTERFECIMTNRMTGYNSFRFPQICTYYTYFIFYYFNFSFMHTTHQPTINQQSDRQIDRHIIIIIIIIILDGLLCSTCVCACVFAVLHCCLFQCVNLVEFVFFYILCTSLPPNIVSVSTALDRHFVLNCQVG